MTPTPDLPLIPNTSVVGEGGGDTNKHGEDLSHSPSRGSSYRRVWLDGYYLCGYRRQSRVPDALFRGMHGCK